MKSATKLECYEIKARRSPCGERGLKFVALPNPFSLSRSLPVRGAWIEIFQLRPYLWIPNVAPRAGSVD